ncbi:MAG: alpha/beta fold hydrolase [Sphingobacteriales bacterium]|nr:alpha/beta fold hydrolase [Sphingobacteriales bacterium]
MQSILTPEACFDGIKDFPYKANYVDYNGLKMHYIDEGDKNGEVILALHGEPTWSYLYRKFVPVLSPKYRFIAPDLIGFGKSEKLLYMKDYTYTFHYNSLKNLIDKLQLKDITLVVQDWGGLIGLGVLGEFPDLFKRVVILNTALADGRKLPLSFKAWQAFARYHPDLPVGGIVRKACARPVSDEVVAAYNAPFPEKKYKAGARIFPSLAPNDKKADGVLQMNRAAGVLSEWKKPAIVLFSDKDEILGKMVHFFYKIMPAAHQQKQITIENAGHFLQEDAGEEIATYIDEFIQEKLKV